MCIACRERRIGQPLSTKRQRNAGIFTRNIRVQESSYMQRDSSTLVKGGEDYHVKAEPHYLLYIHSCYTCTSFSLGFIEARNDSVDALIKR